MVSGEKSWESSRALGDLGGEESWELGEGLGDLSGSILASASLPRLSAISVFIGFCTHTYIAVALDLNRG